MSFTQRVLNVLIPGPVSRVLRANFAPTVPLPRRLLAVLPAGLALGAGIELFMNKTGFYTVLTRKEGERRAEKAFHEREFKAKRDARRKELELKQAQLQQQQQQVQSSTPGQR